MVIKEFDITLDLIKSKQLSPIEVVQGDFETNIFNIQITKDYVPVDLTGITLEVLFAKPDNTTVLQDNAVISDAAQGKIQLILNTNTIAAPGMVYAEIRIKEAGKIATTAKFSFYVRKAIVSNVVSTNEFPVLEQLIEDVEQLKTDIVNLQVPDGSLTDVKLSNDAGQIKDRVSIMQQTVDTLEQKIDAPDYSAPQEATASVITLPDDVVEGQFSDIVIKGKTLLPLLNYNRDTWAEWLQPQMTTVENQSILFTGDGSYKFRQIQIPAFQSGDKFGVLYYVPKNTATAGTKGVVLINDSGSSEVSNYVGAGTTTGWKKGILTANNLGKYFRLFINTAVTSGEIAFKDVQLYKLPSGSEIESDFETMTADELAQKYPYIQGGGVVSTESVRVKSVGKNLFDKNKAVHGYYVDRTTGSLLTKNYCYVSDYIRVKPNTTYGTSIVPFESSTGGFAFYDVNKKYISGINAVTTFTTPINAVYVRLTIPQIGNDANWNYTDINVVQLELGTTATAYEPYTETSAYTPSDIVLRSLPNGTKDEINVTTGKGTQRIKKYVLQSSDVVAMYTSYTNVDCARVAKPLDSFMYDKTTPTTGSGILEGCTELPAGIFVDDANNIGKVLFWAMLQNMFVVFPKGTTLEQARASLAGKTLIYQLATPIPHEGKAQPLTAFPNGHIIIEPVVRVTKPYNGGITVDKPIQAIESIVKVEDGARTPIDVTKATVASDKLSLTITGASDNEIYEIIYQYPSELTTLPTIRYRYPLNTAAAIDANTKTSSANSKAINDFIAYQNAVNLQFDLRITALEP